MDKRYPLRSAARWVLLLTLLASAVACKGVTVHIDVGPTEVKVGTPTILSTLAASEPSATATEAEAPAAATATETSMPPTPTSTDTPAPPTATLTNTPLPPTATPNPPTATPKPPTPTATLTPSLTPIPQAEVTFTADKTKISAGNCTTLRWDVKNANAVYLDGVGVVAPGNKKVCPGSTTTYKLHVDAPGGDVDKEITIKVV